MTERNRIAEFFAGKKILITGGTGLVGKPFVEKLLRDCPQIDTIYLLIRNKKGKSSDQRLLEILNGPLFERVRNERGLDTIKRQCKVISGDCMNLGLGISEEDRKEIASNVTIVYNFAATIRFDELLSRATLLNVRAVREIIGIAKECNELELLVHMSTSYCYLDEKYLLEKSYDPPANPHKLIQLVEMLDEEEIRCLTKKFLGNYPNTYAFTKALGEALICEVSKQIPTLILRPSILIPIWQEPIVGWTDNVNGAIGLLIAGGKGVIRIMHCDFTSYADFVPVDLLANILLISTWNYVKLNDNDRKFIHCVSSAEIKLSWQEIIDIAREVCVKTMPFDNVLWYPEGGFTRNRLSFLVQAFFFHWIPAYLVDVLLVLLGYPAVLKKAHRRIANGFEVVNYYTNNQWDFCNDGLVYLRTLLNETEVKIFKIDPEGLNIHKYVEACILSARRYILNEPDSTIPRARKIMKIMYFADRICKFVFMTYTVYLIYKIFLVIFDKTTKYF